MISPMTLLDTRFQRNNQVARSRLLQQVRYIGRAGLYARSLAPVADATEARIHLCRYALAPEWDGPVAFHRLLISVRADSALAGQPALVRLLSGVALDELGALLDRELVWLGGVHTDTDNTHAHLLLAGGDPRGRSVEIRPRALATFKVLIERHATLLAG